MGEKLALDDQELAGVEADPEALEVIARRAAGSMRDSQSLLEQLLAFAPGKITLADVHGMLGTAGDERLTALLGHVVERQPAAALAELDTALREGVDPATVFVTGNTVIDALRWMRRHVAGRALPAELDPGGSRLILVTAHRRESFGAPFVAMVCRYFS